MITKREIVKKIKFFLKKIYIEIIKIKIFNNIHIPNKNSKIRCISIDTSNFHTKFCQIGMRYVTDKTPYNGFQSQIQKVKREDYFGHVLHRHAYTGIYHFLFNEVKNSKLNICEIGIHKNESVRMLRHYFKNSNIYAFEYDLDLLKKAKTQKLKNVFYEYTDVRNDKSLINTFKKSKVKFDIIFDDSTHNIWDQSRIIKICHAYLKKKSYLILEDLWKKRIDQNKYYQTFKPYLKYYSDFFFIDSVHRNEFSPLWNNSKLFILKKF